jgi:hypothetical protein
MTIGRFVPETGAADAQDYAAVGLTHPWRGYGSGMDDAAYAYLSENVNVAIGVVAEQHHCTVADALAQLRSRADGYAETLENTALDVLGALGRAGP